ncbi:hypothetical protein OLX02_14980 [Novosphingobium sp. KCTC 2891]|uniref:linalool dehydratase/isomerase domain-containing protein n=1 Tax=Novosphingobium sp. KCTC 2891 TaxID=2989730 RepID=UPI002221AADE|nr:hypothetical protein [Novosphingobium sp. KCTC 2891]MCW1384125.1 hypothetical protein [Novosphingobium sp. KCTC 2891]
MATIPLERDIPGLSPHRGIKGPVTAARQRRSWTIYAALCLAGLAPTLLGLAPAWRAAGLGLWIPGGGFLAVGGWAMLLFPLVMVLFVASLVAWFWAGVVVAPVIVWLGSAALAGAMSGPTTWAGAPIAVPLAAGAVILAFARSNRKAHAAGLVKAAARSAFLPKSFTEVAQQSAHEPDPAKREMDAEQLAGLRYLLDRALQPVDRFDGFTIIDQFQPAALRYQINHMGFALAVAQTAYLPNFRGYMGLAQRNLIEKYLEKKVWDYWVYESCWGHLNFTDWDPAGRDNIMLTGWFGAHVGGYMLATGDRRYMEPGSLTFRLNDRKAWRHDFRTINGSVDANYAKAEFGIFACEPNWLYPICNHYGMLSLVTHDALTGSRLVDRHIDGWVRGIDDEFTDSSGSIVGLRSQLTGMPVPFPVGEAGYAFFENTFLPTRARQLWAIAREEIAPLVSEDAQGPRMTMPGEGLDAGKYGTGHVGAYGTYLVSAREFGDERLAAAALAGLERDCQPQRDGGVLRFAKGSNISNATAIMGLLMDTGDFRRTFTEGPSKAALAGPMIETLEYPAVLVTRAWSDGTGLEATFVPGAGAGRHTIGLSQLEPGRRYVLEGAVETDLVAAQDGTATFTIDLPGRIEVTLRAG